MATLSLYSIQALAQIITGGPGTLSPEEEAERIAPYRTQSQIRKFFNALRLDIELIGSQSRVRAVEELLSRLLGQPGSLEKVVQIIEQALDPRHFKEDPDLLVRAVASLNEHLEYDGWALQEVNGRHRMLTFQGVPGQHRPRGVEGAPKNLIFASTGPKPEIVLTDAINNDVRIARNGQFCLIYDRPILETGLSWSNLVQWWAEQERAEISDPEVPRSLYRRLLQATKASVPEKLLFETYYHMFKDLGPKLPALLPQVYLHYDPRTVRELYGEKRLVRQRMDFLLLFSGAIRVVVEVDGAQHYSTEGGKPSPTLYAEMVAADRQLRLAGYEVFRFGGAELQGDAAKEIVVEFFRALFKRHGVNVMK